LGIGGAISFSTNPVYKEALLRKLKTKINQYEQPDIPSFADISFEQEFWSYVLLLVGPTLSIPGERIQWNLKAHLGLSVIFPPTETLEASFDNSTYYHSADAQNLSFCYAFGADAIYKLQSNYSIKLGANYIHTQSEKQTHLNYTEDNTTQLLEGFTKKDVLNALHLTLGLAYLF